MPVLQGVGVSALSSTAAVSENGGTSTFTVRLNTQPTSDVSLAVSSSSTALATVSASSLTFTSSNWNTAQTVTVTGVDNSVDASDASATITIGNPSSSDSNYNGASFGTSRTLTLTDDDTAVSCLANPATEQLLSICWHMRCFEVCYVHPAWYAVLWVAGADHQQLDCSVRE